METAANEKGTLMLFHFLIVFLVRMFNATAHRVFGSVNNDYRVHMFFQNLNEDRTRKKILGEPKGVPYRGRAHLRILDFTFSWEWDLWTTHTGARLYVNDADDAFEFFIGFPPVGLWWSFGSPSLSRLAQRLTGRGYTTYALSFGIHDAAIWWNIWTPRDEWTRATPRYRNGSWHPIDTFLGKHVYREGVGETHHVLIPMPEGGYPATIKVAADSWKRPLWFRVTRHRARVEIPSGIPHQGKGENSWDCGEDALFELTCAAASVEDAIGKVVASVLESRRKYDGNRMAKYPPAAEYVAAWEKRQAETVEKNA